MRTAEQSPSGRLGVESAMWSARAVAGAKRGLSLHDPAAGYCTISCGSFFYLLAFSRALTILFFVLLFSNALVYARRCLTVSRAQLHSLIFTMDTMTMSITTYTTTMTAMTPNLFCLLCSFPRSSLVDSLLATCITNTPSPPKQRCLISTFCITILVCMNLQIG